MNELELTRLIDNFIGKPRDIAKEFLVVLRVKATEKRQIEIERKLSEVLANFYSFLPAHLKNVQSPVAGSAASPSGGANDASSFQSPA